MLVSAEMQLENTMHLREQELLTLSKYIVESDAIECITRSHRDVLAQLKADYPRGHVGAYVYLLGELERGATITKEMICNTQALIVSEQEEFGIHALPTEQIGRWRTVNVSVGGRNCPHPNTIPASMNEWVEHAREWQEELSKKCSVDENLRFMALAHFAYLHIHPFADGNGRSSRAIAYALFKHAKVPPILFTSQDRHATYYRCFKDPEDMVRYFLMRTI